MTYALILAGGSGRRFWPVSRDSHPKQLLSLFGGKSMIEDTVDRLSGLVPPENILVLTNPVQEQGVRKALATTDIPAENILAEPERRDTAPAIALAVAWVAARDPEATMVVLPSDSHIQNAAAFRETLAHAIAVASTTEALVTLGIKPTWPCPGYGYIERASQADLPGPPVYEVAKFREKPDPETAQRYLDSGNFYWNAGIFLWSIPTVRGQFDAHCPDLSKFITRVAESATPSETALAEFATLPKLSIDFALMEKATRVLNIGATFDWDDLGSWTSVAEYLEKDDSNNRTNAPLTTIGAKGNVIYSDDPEIHIALIGVDDLIIVRTADSILITRKDQADQIKTLTDALPPKLLK